MEKIPVKILYQLMEKNPLWPFDDSFKSVAETLSRDSEMVTLYESLWKQAHDCANLSTPHWPFVEAQLLADAGCVELLDKMQARAAVVLK